jgi:hypothetical protein
VLLQVLVGYWKVSLLVQSGDNSMTTKTKTIKPQTVVSFPLKATGYRGGNEQTTKNMIELKTGETQ